MAKRNRKFVALVLITVVGLAVAVVGYLAVQFFVGGGGDPKPFVDQAVTLMGEERYEEAILPLQRAVAESAEPNARIHFLLAECYLKQRPDPDLSRTLGHYKEAKRIAQSDQLQRSELAKYVKALAEFYAAIARLPDAAAETRQLIKLEPENDSHRRMLAHISARASSMATAPSEQSQYLEQSLDAAREAVQVRPDNVENYQLTAELILARDEPDTLDRAEALMKDAVSKVRDKEKAHLFLAKIHRRRAAQAGEDVQKRREHLDRATTAYRDALEAAPDNVDALLGLGELAMQQEDREQAESYFRQAIEKAPERDTGYAHLMKLQRGAGEIDKALQTARRALEATPTEVVAESRDRSRILERRGLLADAAEILIGLGKLDEAKSFVDRIRTLVTGDPYADYLRGRVALHQGRLDEAVEKLSRAADAQSRQVSAPGPSARRGRQEAQTRFWLGQAYSAMDLQAKAREEFDQAATLLEGSESRLTLEVRRSRAQLLARLGEYDEAIRDARWALQRNPEDGAVLRLLGEALVLDGQTEAALEAAKKAVEVDPREAGSYRVLASVYMRKEQIDQAERTLRDGLEKAENEGILYRDLALLYKRGNMPEKLEGLLDRVRDDPELTDGQKEAIGQLRFESREELLEYRTRQARQHPNDPRKVRQMAASLAGLGRQEEALDAYRKAYDLAVKQDQMDLAARIWDDAWILLLTAEDSEEAEKWIDVLPETEEMIRQRKMARGLLELTRAASPPPSEVEGLSGREVVGARVAHVEKALELFEQMLEEETGPVSDVRVLEALARAHYLKGTLLPHLRTAEYEEAERLYSRVLQIQPQSADTRIRLANVYLSLNRFDQATAQAADILDRQPEEVRALDVQALAQQGRAAYADAERTRRTIRDIAPENVGNLVRLGRLLRLQGKTSQAIDMYREALELNPQNAEAAQSLALILYDRTEAGRKKADAVMSDYVAAASRTPGARMQQARYYRQTGRVDKALRLSRELLEQSPDSDGVAVFLSTLLLDAGRADEAVEVLDRFLQKHPENLDVKLQLCDVMMVAGTDLDRAEALTKEVVGELPNSPRAVTILSRILLKKGRNALLEDRRAEAEGLFARARQRLQQLVDRMPRFGEAYLTLAELSYVQGEKVRALDYLSRVGRNDPKYLQAMKRRVQINRELGNREQVVLDLRAVLDVQPHDFDSRRALVDLYIQEGRLADAEQLLRNGLRYDPDDPELLSWLSRVLLRQRQPGEAQEVADRAVRVAPESPVSWSAWVAVMRSREREDEALEQVLQLREAHVESVGFNVLAVDLLNALGRYDRSKKILESLIAEHPADPRMYLKYADTLMLADTAAHGGEVQPETIQTVRGLLEEGLEKTGRHQILLHKQVELAMRQDQWDRATELCNELVERFPNDAVARVRLSECALQLGRTDEALRWARKATEIDPTQFSAWNNRAWILATEKGELTRAKNFVNQALRLSPRHPSLLDTAGWIEYLDKDADEAIRLLERSIRQGETAVARYHLAKAFLLRAEKTTLEETRREALAEAKENFERYLELAPSGEYAEEVQKSLQEM